MFDVSGTSVMWLDTYFGTCSCKFNMCLTVHHLVTMVKKKSNEMQQDRYIDKSKLARHVSGNNFADLQEH
jgi:hypothetical protein